MATRVGGLLLLFPALLLLHLPAQVRGDCWLIEGDKGYVWLAICSQNQPPYETIPQHINSTVSVNSSIPPFNQRLRLATSGKLHGISSFPCF